MGTGSSVGPLTWAVMNHWQQTKHCYCNKCSLKKARYMEQTGQQLKYHLENYGPGLNHPHNSSVLIPAASTLSESTDLCHNLSKSIPNNTQNHTDDEENSPILDQGLSRLGSFKQDVEFTSLISMIPTLKSQMPCWDLQI